MKRYKKNFLFCLGLILSSILSFSALVAMEKEGFDFNIVSKIPSRVLCVPKGWDSYVSCEFHELHCELEKLGWLKLEIDEINNVSILNSIKDADIVLLFEGYEFIEKNIKDITCNTKKVFFCDDVHYMSSAFKQRRLSAFNWADLILATYPEKLLQFFPEISKDKVIWAPHSSASCFSPNLSPKCDKLLLSGSRSWAYPFRQLCEQIISREICDVIDHPGYPGYPGNKNIKIKTDTELMKQYGGEKYVDLLRKYPTMIVCGSLFHYLVAKVFEGMASGCLVLCDRDSLGSQLARLGFEEDVHYIGTDILHVKEDAAIVHKMYSENKEKWEIIVQNALKKVNEEHTTSVRAKQVNLNILDFFKDKF